MWRTKISIIVIAAIIFSGLSWVQSPAFAAVSDWQKGATIWPQSQTELSSEGYKQSLQKWKSIGGDYVSITVNTFQKNENSSDFMVGYNTPTDQSLIDGINYAHSLGLKVNLKMHHDVENYSVWRAYLTPSDRELWFRNYNDMLLKYGNIAKSTNVEMITIGTEMINMTTPSVHANNTNQWRSIISNLRSIYSGLLTYSANWGDTTWYYELGAIEFWDQLDFIGISGYFYMTSSHSYTPASLQSKWASWNNSHVKPVQQKYNKPILFTEIGYRSVDGALIAPPKWTSTGNVDEQEQADGYNAMFEYWSKQPVVKGIHIWQWESNVNAGGPTNNDFTPQNKLAEKVINSWFKNGSYTPSQEIPPVSIDDKDIVLYASDINSTSIKGNWSKVSDATAANSIAIKNPNLAAPKLTIPKTAPTSYFEMTFNAEANTPYHVWFRIKADRNAYENDSIYLQFSDSQDLNGTANYRIGTDKALMISLEEGANAGMSGWGWNDNGYGNLGAHIKFQNSGTHTLRVQQREDGLLIDQIVLSPKNYFTVRPGATKNDTTIIKPAAPTPTPSPAPAPTPSPTPTPTPPAPTTPPPPPTNAKIDVWWPNSASPVNNGVFALQALINGKSLAEYDMYWQVDGDRLNPMYDSYNNGAHKEAWVDVSGWTWRGNGPYKITFVVKDKSGSVIAQQEVSITISR